MTLMTPLILFQIAGKHFVIYEAYYKQVSYNVLSVIPSQSIIYSRILPP